jgi:hypothetical protein
VQHRRCGKSCQESRLSQPNNVEANTKTSHHCIAIYLMPRLFYGMPTSLCPLRVAMSTGRVSLSTPERHSPFTSLIETKASMSETLRLVSPSSF